MLKKKILAIVGARPQFIKHAPLELELEKRLNLVTVHTGQHYDKNMSEVFFDQLGIRKPEYNLAIKSGSHGKQTALMMEGLEEVVFDEKPDMILVYGDTNSTLAGALVGAKLHIPIAHVEAGLRSFNKSMPEEINRICTDHVSSLLFVSNEESRRNLTHEGINEHVYVVGDVMQDMLTLIESQNLLEEEERTPYYLATIHRPYNTDERERLVELLMALNNLDKKVIFPMHPRTKHAAGNFGLTLNDFGNIEIIDPIGYVENMRLLKYAFALLTDSGGMQKEAYWLQRQCITIRSETEWTETLEHGWNTLVFSDLNLIQSVLLKSPGIHDPNIYGDGQASKKIGAIIDTYL